MCDEVVKGLGLSTAAVVVAGVDGAAWGSASGDDGMLCTLPSGWASAAAAVSGLGAPLAATTPGFPGFAELK